MPPSRGLGCIAGGVTASFTVSQVRRQVNPTRSLRVVLATVGTRGDVQPMLALAQALAERGHVPVLAAPPNFEAWIRSLGFEFSPLGVDIRVMFAQQPDLLTGNPWRMLKGAVRYLGAQPALQMHQLKGICASADVMLYGGLALFVAPSVCESLDLPGFGVLFTTSLLPSDQHPPPTIPWHGLPPWLNQLIWRVDRPLGNLLLRGRLNRARASLGLLPVPDIWSHLLSGNPPSLAVDEILLPADNRWQGRYPYANFLFLDDPAALDPELEAWLYAGEPPVFVGFGSMSGQATQRIERLIVEAVSATGRRCIVGAGWAAMSGAALPPGWRVVSDAPHARLFPRAAVVVHHGGSGTTAQALRAGVPQVVLPLILDQFHHAHRLYLMGLAPRPLPMEKVTAAGLTQAIEAALALPAGPRATASARLLASHGREQIVQRVEALFAH